MLVEKKISLYELVHLIYTREPDLNLAGINQLTSMIGDNFYHKFIFPKGEYIKKFSKVPVVETRIKKPHGGYRRVCAYHPWYLSFYKTLLDIFQDLCPAFPAEIVGCVKGESLAKIAQTFSDRMSSASVVGHIDIVRWFDSIRTCPHVEDVMKDFIKPHVNRYNKEVKAARTLAEIVTYKGNLAQGNPMSAFIANYVCTQTWGPEIVEYANRNKLFMRIYVDNIYVVKDAPPYEVRDHMKDIGAILSSHGFHTHKLSTMSPKHKQKVLGFILNKKGINQNPRVSINLKRKLNSIMYNLKKHGTDAVERRWLNYEGASFCKDLVDKPALTILESLHLRRVFRSWLMGQISWVAQSGRDAELAKKYKATVATLYKK